MPTSLDARIAELRDNPPLMTPDQRAAWDGAFSRVCSTLAGTRDDVETVGVADLMALRDQIKALTADRDALQSKLRMIVSHATMGSTTGEGQSTNDICVLITALRNDLWRDAQAAALAPEAKR